ncbi:MAG: hypothetical protein AB7H97_19985 [Pseudobdellovibrionaceae bacterium]
MASANRKKALSAIEECGAVLVFPVANKKNPVSLWYKLHPRTEMKWEWSENGDDRVPQLWYLREELSRSNQVVYSKWYQNRATFFSKELFTHLLSYLRPEEGLLPHDSNTLLEALKMDSPLSTKHLKAAAELQGRLNESLYNRAMKVLWDRLLIVGFGEIDDSSFPSLAVGATQNIFEELWIESQSIDSKNAEKYIFKKLGEDSLFLKYARKVKAAARAEQEMRK